MSGWCMLVAICHVRPVSLCARFSTMRTSASGGIWISGRLRPASTCDGHGCADWTQDAADGLRSAGAGGQAQRDSPCR